MVGQVVAMAMACMAAAAGHEAAADSVDTLSRELRQVSVTGRRVASQLASDRGVSVVGMGLMRSMPRILGNAAPLHYAQMLPGIQTGGEYDAGLHIQGSDNSHNMLAIDGVPIYNAAHLQGFFSVFNATHFSSMRIGKSATAAAAPNRLGGMVDMQAGRDRPPGPTGDVAVGPMSSQATVSLPAGRCSWLTLSARAAYFNLLYSRWLEVDGEELGYFFHDYNLTYTYAPDSRNRLWAEVYYGGDDASYGDGGYDMDTSLGWANFMAALHWDHSSGATGIGQCVYYTRYGSRLGLSQPSVGLSLESRIATAGYKAEARFGQASAGIDAAWHDVSPQEPRADGATAGRVAGRRWSFGAAMVVASGTPYTRVERFYMLGNHVLSDYGPHNGERLPPYVRLDLSASYDFSVGRGRRSGINLSLYNVTAHDNVLFYRLKVNEVEYAYRPFAFALRLMPSVNYYFSF